MKNLVIGLFVIGLTTLGFSQEKKGQVDEVQLKDVVISHHNTNAELLTNINYTYLDKVQDKTTSGHVKLLESVASRFNVMASAKFDGRDGPFKTIFRGSKGYIVATYDSKGKILSTQERYRDIKIPPNMSISVLKEYPNSDILKMVHTVSYKDKEEVRKVYRIQIMNGNSKKNLKIIANDNQNYNNAFTMVLEK